MSKSVHTNGLSEDRKLPAHNIGHSDVCHLEPEVGHAPAHGNQQGFLRNDGEGDPGIECKVDGAEPSYTLLEVMALQRISRTTLWRWRNEHGLRVVCIKGIKRIRKTDLAGFLDDHLN